MYQDQIDNEKTKGRLPLAAVLAVLVLTLVGCGGLASASPAGALGKLTYSIYNQGALTQEEMGDVAVLVMLNGEPVVVTNEGGQIMLNGEVNITESGIQACNGVIYVINESLTPTGSGEEATPEVTEPAEATPEVTEEPGTCGEGETIADILQADPRFTEFVAALDAAGLLDALDQPGAFTIFAAPDEVFDEITPTPEGTQDATETSTTITICHATSSAKNPFNLITVDVHGLAGHSKHAGDIIPAPAEGCPGDEVTPTPVPTETPMAVPTDTAVPTTEVTPTDVPTEVPTEVPTVTFEPPIP
jgi:uncharacterized surface protein with fasciclin (FAS1) repeats